MEPIITQKLVELGTQTASKPVASFSELIALKFFGKSIAVLKAEGEVEVDKVKSRWEQIEKPMWLQAEAVKMNRQYNNLGNVLQRASKYIEDGKIKISDDNDLFWGLLEHSKEITNDEMQELIAKIIAGEFNNPNSYSMSTLQVIKSLGKNELAEFEKLGSFLINDNVFLIDFFSTAEPQSQIRKKLNVSYSFFVELQNLGLIQSSSHSYQMDLKKGAVMILQYQNVEINCMCKLDKKYNMPALHSLTSAGREIIKHLTPPFSQDFYEWLQTYFSNNFFDITKKTQA